MRVRVVACVAASNAVGTINDVARAKLAVTAQAPIAAQEAFDLSPEDDAGSVFAPFFLVPLLLAMLHRLANRPRAGPIAATASIVGSRAVGSSAIRRRYL